MALAVADLVNGGVPVFSELLDGRRSEVVYGDPPWSPGNEKWWRWHAGLGSPRQYEDLLRAWAACAVACQPEHVFVEQSANALHAEPMISILRDALPHPVIEAWEVVYGSPRRANALYHFGLHPLRTDPTGLAGDRLVARVFSGLHYSERITVADPCIGLGTTARCASAMGWNCIGTELDPARLARVSGWLRKHGYQEVSHV